MFILYLVLILCVFSGSNCAQATEPKAPNFRRHLASSEKRERDSDTITNCGYQSCNPVKDGLINVHIVCHTHTDPGWLKTADQYYYGSMKSASPEGVQYILDSVVQELYDDESKTRRFSYSEMSFFTRWWNEQDSHTQHKVKTLVKEGRLEFIMGAWTMNDEAAAHYNAIIDQQTLGFQFLNETFGQCGRPRAAWQIDPFGHSRGQASLFAQVGYDGLLFGRLDYQDKAQRLQNKTMEMVWMASENLGTEAALWTGALYNMYMPPGGFCFDLTCSDDPIMDDKRLHDYNVDQKVSDFIKAARDQANHYKANHIIMTFGEDYQYQNANAWYKNIDKLIKYVNSLQTNDSDVNVLYSTPSCYFYAKNKASLAWTAKTDDFFPYADKPHAFWTGYFTSRPTAKRYSRYANNFLQVCKQLHVLAKLGTENNSTNRVKVLREAIAVMQTHDGISGTEKQPVADDFNMRIANGISECQDVVNNAYGKLLPLKKKVALPQVFCHYLNVSYCNITEKSDSFTVTAYNPVARPLSSWVRFPVAGSGYTVLGPDSKTVDAQLVLVSTVTTKLLEHNGSIATTDLLFKASLPPVGFSTYFVTKTSHDLLRRKQQSVVFSVPVKQDVVIMNQFISLTFDGSTGLLKQMTNLGSKISIPLQQSVLFYKGFIGNNSKPEFQSSGAYVFRPDGNDPTPVSTSATLNVIRDENKGVQFTVLTDRSQGGSSIKDGQIEIMVHRRCLHDDSYGVNEALNETGITGAGLVVRGKHYLILDTMKNSGYQHRALAEKIFMSPWLSFANLSDMTVQEYTSKFRTMWSGVKSSLPDNVRLLTLEQWNHGTLLLRLEHFLEKYDDAVLSVPATVSLQDLFTPFTIKRVEELTLGANQFLKDAKRLIWKTQDGRTNNPDMSSYFVPLRGDSGLDVTLNPMQIRTFMVTIQK